MQVMALYMLCGKHHRHSLVRHSLVQLLHALRWHHGSFPSLHMGHSMIRRCIQLCISRGHTICTHILVLISAGAKAQASVSSGQARQTTPAGEGGNDCGEKAQCNETLPKALQKAIPTAPQAVLLRAFPMRCNFPASRLREGNTLQPSLHMPTTVQPYFNTAH